MDLSNKKILFIIPGKDFRDEELIEPRRVLEGYRAKTIIANNTGETSKGMLGAKSTPDLTIDKVNINDYDAIVFVGGMGSPCYWDDKRAHEIIKEANLKGKIICSICLASGTLAKAGILKGKNATGWPDTQKIVEENDGTYTGKDVEVDGRIITSKGPHAAKEFGEEIAKALGKNLKD